MNIPGDVARFMADGAALDGLVQQLQRMHMRTLLAEVLMTADDKHQAGER